jgi:hypothetical protein
MQTDAAFLAWFSAFRDLDATDMHHSVAVVAANADFGATPEQRLRRLALARKVAGALGFLAAAVAIWSFLWPQPYALLMASLAALPLLALILVVLSRGLFRIFAWTKIDAGLGMVFSLPTLAVMFRVLFDLNMVSVLPLIGAAAIGAGVFVSIITVADRKIRSQPAMLVVCGLVAGLYFFGVIGEANALLDRSPLSVIRSQIVAKHVSRGKTTTYHFTLAPWGARSDPDDASVPRDLYDRLQPGNPVCVLLHNGELGMPWFVVRGCS